VGSPYLAQTLRSQGVLLNTYYGTAHNSQPNYVAQISGQGPNAQMQADCQVYSQVVATSTATSGQVVGNGCVFPSSVPNLTGSWSQSSCRGMGYREDMATPCRHPALNAPDPNQQAKFDDATVRSFLPLLVRRYVREELQANLAHAYIWSVTLAPADGHHGIGEIDPVHRIRPPAGNGRETHTEPADREGWPRGTWADQWKRRRYEQRPRVSQPWAPW
jgi:hypothetical protein